MIFSPPLFRPFLLPTPLLALIHHPDLSIRYLALELLTVSIGIADAAKAKWTEDYIGSPETPFPGPWEGRTIDYAVLPLLECERAQLLEKAIRERNYYREPRLRNLLPSDLGINMSEICGILIPRFNGTRVSSSTIVMTENTKANLKAIAREIVSEKPLLLQSVPGAGKSFLIDQTAKLFGRYDGTSFTVLSNHRHCSNYSYRSNGWQTPSWNLRYINPRNIFLATGYSHNCSSRGKMGRD